MSRKDSHNHSGSAARPCSRTGRGIVRKTGFQATQKASGNQRCLDGSTSAPSQGSSRTPWAFRHQTWGFLKIQILIPSIDPPCHASVGMEKKAELTSPIAKAVSQAELTQLEPDWITLREEINAHLDQLETRTREADQAQNETASLLILAEEWTFATR